MKKSMFEQFRKNPIDNQTWDAYQGYFKRIEIPARTILLNEGEVSKKVFFIEKGCVRVWFNKDEKDVIFQFFLKTTEYPPPKVLERISRALLP